MFQTWPWKVREIRTPHIDGLAKQGVRLTDADASACVCSPTRASLLTGRYP
jgi:arylsulfatase A-like enzyme